MMIKLLEVAVHDIYFLSHMKRVNIYTWATIHQDWEWVCYLHFQSTVAVAVVDVDKSVFADDIRAQRQLISIEEVKKKVFFYL